MKSALGIRFVVIYPGLKHTSSREDRYDDKIEEIWITALSNAGANCNVDMPDSITRSCG